MNKQTIPVSYAALSSALEPLIAWFSEHRRSLPWRDDPTPYHVWLSEIMLQQTRIEAVLPYYERFLSVCPTVTALSEVDDGTLMKLWEGLGYYSRARNLKKAAAVIVKEHGGVLPADYEALRALPGIGAYTAGAIASIAYGLPEPAVDGNVLRVITRLVGCTEDITKESTKRTITATLREIYPAGERASDLTQAIMELGQRVCIPNGEPHCRECPLGAFCCARMQELTNVIPVKAQKKPRRQEQLTILLLLCGDKVAIQKRGSTGLLAGLWEFPALRWYPKEAELQEALHALCGEVDTPGRDVDAVHIFTHVEWHMQAYVVRCATESENFVWVSRSDLAERYAVPSAFRAYVKRIDALLP